MINDPAKIKSLAVKALDNIHRMSGMINELLDTMAFHSGEQLSLVMAQFDICEVIKEVQVDALSLHGPRIQIVGPSVIGWWNRSAMRRALENMIGNAFKYGRAGSPVTIKAKEVEGRLLVTVHNEGDPIPPEEREAIFQMYRRTEKAKLTRQQGWGIGLPYVRAVAESHGGSIAVDSTAERGTTFAFEIPQDCRPYLGAPTIA